MTNKEQIRELEEICKVIENSQHPARVLARAFANAITVSERPNSVGQLDMKRYCAYMKMMQSNGYERPVAGDALQMELDSKDSRAYLESCRQAIKSLGEK